MSATFTAISKTCWKCGRENASISTGDYRWFHPECMPNYIPYSPPHSSTEIADLERQLAEARARLAAMYALEKAVQHYLFIMGAGPLVLAAKYGPDVDAEAMEIAAFRELAAALPPPPKEPAP